MEQRAMDDKPKIRDFLSRFAGKHRLGDDDDIFALGFVNSLFAMQLVLFVEQSFALTVTDEDLDLDNFRSVNAISALVQRKVRQALSS
jgi:methoxymalonate biosynthesis acyl carrier protein